MANWKPIPLVQTTGVRRRSFFVREICMNQIQSAAVLSAFLVLLGGCYRSASVAERSSQTTGTVTIEIVTEQDTQSIEFHDVATGTSLEQIMRKVEDVPITVQGSGMTAFVDKIGDLSTGSGDGWTFEIDGQFANQGIGNTKLSPPTTVTWRFGDFDSAE